MKQVLHIFKKDVRHCWPQIVLLLIILFAYTWSEIRGWRPAANLMDVWYGQFLAPATVLLVVLGWWSLLGRSIQDEKLVGDRQFWLTRPYRWPELLASKALFALAFINLPLLIVQLILLSAAGFNPWHYVPNLLWMQAIVSLTYLLPVAALATVTSTLGQILIMLLAGGVFLIGVAALAAKRPSGFPTSETVISLLTSVVVIVGGVTVILWQYSRRRTVRSRGLLAGCAALVPVIMMAIPYDTLINGDFPPLATGQQAPVQLALDRSRAVPQGGPEPEKEVNIFFPMSVTGVANDAVVSLAGQRISIEGPDGFHWSSGWESTYGDFFPWSSRFLAGGFAMKREVFDRIKQKEVRVHILYAMTVYRGKESNEVTATERQFEIPSGSLCELNPGYRNSMQCRVALSHPALLITAAAGACALPGNHPSNAGYNWIANSDTEGGISPVQSFGIGLQNKDLMPKGGDETNPPICPGEKLNVSAMVLAGRVGVPVDIDGIKLENYRWDPMYGSGGMYGIDIHRH